MCTAVPQGIPELGAPQFGYMLQQKHLFSRVSPVCLILAKLLYSFHSLAVGIHSFYALFKLNLVGSLLPTLCCLTAALGHSEAPREAAVAVGARAFGRRAGLHAVCYCLLLRTEAYAKHCAWSMHELCIIPLPLGIAGGFSKYLLVSIHFLFLCLLPSIQPMFKVLQQQQSTINVKVFGISEHLFILGIYTADYLCPDGASWNYHISITT